MKAARLLSPAGFALVLLLFLFLPFLSVSCDVPGQGEVSADYRGTHLVSGTEPDVEVSPDVDALVTDMTESTGTTLRAPDSGVPGLAIVVAVVLLAGVALPFVPRLTQRARALCGAALAVGAGALMIVTQAVARSNVTDELLGEVPKLELGIDVAAGDVIDRLVHTEVWFWQSLVVLTAIALGSVGYVYRDRIFAQREPDG
jgi:hypothetical protein